MNRSFKLLLAGIFIAIIFLLSGCTTTTYYGGYYAPPPSWGYRGHRHVDVDIDIDRPGKPDRPNIGRPVQPPSRPTPRRR